MLKRILVPLDGTPQSEAVLAHLPGLARPQTEGGTEVLLCMPLARFRRPAVAESMRKESVRDSALRYASDVAKRLEEDGLTAHTLVTTGNDPAEAILDVASREASSMIALAVRRRSGLRRWLVADSLRKVVARTPVPVFLSGPHVSRPTGMTHFVLPMQPNGGTRNFVPPVAHLAHVFGSRVTVVYIGKVIRPLGYVLSREQKAIDEVISELAGGDVSVFCRFARGLFGRQVPKTARNLGADLIVSSTACGLGLARDASAPVLVLPSESEAPRKQELQEGRTR